MTFPTRTAALRRILPAVGAAAGLGFLVHGVDVHRAATALRDADPRWLAGGVVLSAVSLLGGACVWIALVRDRAPHLPARTLLMWHFRSLLAGQVLPTGAGGDAVRGLAVARMADTGTALGSIALGRVMSALAMALWGAAGAIALHDAVGAGVVVTACAFVVALTVALALALHADSVVGLLGRSRRRTVARAARGVAPLADTLSAWRGRPGLVSLVALMGTAGWGINLAALTLFARAVGVDAGWQVFAVTIPVTLAATWLPLSANGIGLREGIL
ncbi:MAG TPA: lysylphosphatidylglycerol synthase transmembrane domain-containing protein, partial [Candidatus Dormibacteraeota bacterium]|nr:lysylphosphatidylglycerol synthase transmembrane domain-containing protein [Candidatus Dormibacteraeota bacterium]